MASYRSGRALICTATAVTALGLGSPSASAQDTPPPTYTQSTVLTLTRGEQARDVAVDNVGNTMVLVGLSGGTGARITYVGTDGTQWGFTVDAPGGGSGIARTDDGTIVYTVGSSLSPTGEVAPGWVTRIPPSGGAAQIPLAVHNPCDVATDGTELVVLDCGTGNNDAQVIRADITSGDTTQTVTGFVQPRGVDLDRAGNLLIGDAKLGDGNSAVVTVGRDGTRTETAVPGFDLLDVAAATDGSPVLAGAEGNAPRIIRLGADGTRTVLPFTGVVYPTGVAVGPQDAVTVSYLEGSSTTSTSRVVKLVPNPVPDPEPEPTPVLPPILGSSGSNG